MSQIPGRDLELGTPKLKLFFPMICVIHVTGVKKITGDASPTTVSVKKILSFES